MKTNPNRQYHALCRKCHWYYINATEETALEEGTDHYFSSGEEGHNIKWFDTMMPLKVSATGELV